MKRAVFRNKTGKLSTSEKYLRLLAAMTNAHQ